ncbi:helix-turn-helix transcriptional regulator [Aquabacterium sp.]|uniref:helix-turn-helix transcriptional regulator n=1 Tax=Aquabacterium sp. TaxID=1872578 RepID=UPI003784B493
MKLSTAIHLLRLLSTRPEYAMTTEEIDRRWRDLGGAEVTLRSIQRYMGQLSDDSEGPSLLETTRKNGLKAYYLRASQVATWFMSEEAALDLQLRRDVFGQAVQGMGRAGGAQLGDMAAEVIAASPEFRRIGDRLRTVPDGIGRRAAPVAPEVVREVIQAIGRERQIQFTYRNAAGKASRHLVTPLGLVAKDGTKYLVGVKGLNDTPRHFALHRASDARMHFRHAQHRPDFNLDDYIHASHQFSHVLDGSSPPIQLKLRVAPETMYHFRERPLSDDQRETAPRDRDAWFTVTATVPRTFLLVPFLVSLGAWVEVVGPAEVRAETAKWVRGMAAHYAIDPPGK